MYLPTCPNCKTIHAERKPPTAPPCESCRVELQVENEEAAKVLMMVRHQTVTEPTKDGMIIDLSLQAVKVAMDLHGVKDQLDCYEKVRQAWHELRKTE